MNRGRAEVFRDGKWQEADLPGFSPLPRFYRARPGKGFWRWRLWAIKKLAAGKPVAVHQTFGPFNDCDFIGTSVVTTQDDREAPSGRPGA